MPAHSTQCKRHPEKQLNKHEWGMSVIPDTWELRKENYRSQASLGNLGTLSLGVSLGIPLYQEL